MKLVVAAACVSSSLAFVTMQTSRLRPACASVAPHTDELLDRVKIARDRCVEDGECEVEQFEEIKGDLVKELEHFQHQLQAYQDDPEVELFVDDADHPSASSDVETRALKRYIDEMRKLHISMSDRLQELDDLISRVSDCRSKI